MKKAGTAVVLPGGLFEAGNVERYTRFLPLTGRIEQMLIDLRERFDDRVGYVTSALAFAVDTIGNRPAGVERLRRLCVADRQFLMVRLSAMLQGEQMWLKVDCPYCRAPFDVSVRRCDLPVKEAKPGFPHSTLRLSVGETTLQVPNGADQEQLGELSEDEAFRKLLSRCIKSVNGGPPDDIIVEHLTPEDIKAIDDELDNLSPAVCNTLLVECAECGRQQHAELDHYDLAGLRGNDLFDDVHTLASDYHWSESSILALPRERRLRYLRMIQRSTAMLVSE